MIYSIFNYWAAARDSWLILPLLLLSDLIRVVGGSWLLRVVVSMFWSKTKIADLSTLVISWESLSLLDVF